MRLIACALLAACSLALPASADMISKTSPHPVNETMDRLEAAVSEAGATIFARVDHAAGAAAIDEELRPTQLLIFGNPKIGTPVMQAAQTAGLDLPLRVLVYEDAGGETRLTYHAPAELALAHGLHTEMPVLQTMSGALDKLTEAAIADD